MKSTRQAGSRVVAIFAIASGATAILPVGLAGQTPTNRALATFPAQQRPPVTNPPHTYMLDDHQYLLAATGDTLWAFLLY